MISVDTYRDAFRAFLKDGMTYSEALDQFDISEFMAAACYEIDQTHQMTLVELYGIAHREKMNEHDLGKATELWLAGWTSETPHETQVDVMSWYWRRPPRRKGKPGRRFLSTDQAYNALRREGSKTHEKQGSNGVPLAGDNFPNLSASSPVAPEKEGKGCVFCENLSPSYPCPYHGENKNL